jgi:translocation and assembly module TamB
MTLDEQAMNITGSLTIPEADIQPTQFNSSVSASKDVVVITQEQSNEASAFPTHINVQLILGDKINLTALGFKARLTGDLLATGNASQQLQGKGQIVIKEGVYNAYGKKLTINDGKILFTGGPIDNPGLDIKAIKRSDEYLVGIQISGLADAPDIKLFSDPSMSDDEILAYLVLGKPLAQASVADAAILASAAAGFGGNGEGIAQKFGLDKLEIEGEGKEDASVELGKNLSPNLYVGYGIGIFDPVNTVNIRYQLSKIWSLRAESGQESGIDLLYTHER